jgi:hypothetical protein
VTSASFASSKSRITTVPTSVRVLEKSVTTPSVTSWSSAAMSFVRREINTPVLFLLKKPIDCPWRWEKIRRRRSCSARCPTQPTR